MRLSLLVIGLLITVQSHGGWFTLNKSSVVKEPQMKVITQGRDTFINVEVPGFNINKVSTIAGQFAEIQIPRHSFTSEIGAPQLPAIRFQVEIDSESASLEVVSSKTHSMAGQSTGIQGDVVPVQLPREKRAGVVVKFQKNESVYNKNALFPSQDARVISINSIRGHKVALIEVTPVKLNPVTRELEFVESLQLKLSGTGEVSQDVKVSGQEFDILGSEAVLNYATSKSVPRSKFLLIVGRGLENSASLQSFIETKRTRGFDIESVHMANIGTTPDSVRNLIRKQYLASNAQLALTHVMIVGDIENVPAHFVDGHYTDSFYASVDKVSYIGDETAPDVAVGRLAIKNKAELDVVVGKLVRYEKNQFTNTAWMKKIAWLATDDRYLVAEGTHNYVINNYSTTAGVTGMFPNNTQAGGDLLYAITHRATQANVVRSVNDGRSFVVYSGHGAVTFWDAPRFTQSDIQNITHLEANPYVMSFACISGSFGASTDSFGETWLKAARGGIGFFGTTNSSYWDEDDILQKAFFDGFYRDKIKTAGMLNIFGLNAVTKGYPLKATYYSQVYNLLGDPTTILKQ
ncbi:MAG: C25 family cysteine peptidase [Oligoflexia bacterium]|nr:C25 family cysteine peptidase [Oligoflexia bacterium]